MTLSGIFALGAVILAGAPLIVIARAGRNEDTVAAARRLRWSFMALLGWAGLAALLLVLLPENLLQRQLARVALDQSIMPLTGRGLRFVRLAGIGATMTLLAAIASLAFPLPVVRRFLDRLAADVQRFSRIVRDDVERWRAATGRSHSLLLPLLVVIGIAARIPSLRRPMSYDESITYVWFVSRSLLDAVTDYAIPNNHVLHTVLAQATTGVLGPTPLAVRLPALFAGLALIPATYWLVRRLLDDRVAIIAAALVTAAPALVEYSSQARGYTLVTLLSLLGFIALTYVRKSETVTGWGLFVFAMALALWTVPTAMYALAIAGIWWIAQSRATPGHAVMRFGLAGLATLVLAILLYAPILARYGPGILIGNEYVQSLALSELLQAIVVRARRLAACWTGALPVAVSGALGLLLVAGVVRRNNGLRHGATLLISMIVGIGAMIALQRVAPQPRFIIIAFLLAAGIAANGLAWMLERARRSDAVTAAVVLTVPMLWGTALELRARGLGFETVPAVRLDPGAEGVHCCAEGYYGDADAVARWAKETVSRNRPLVAYAGSGLVETVRYSLMHQGAAPTLVHPYRPQYDASQFAAYDEIYVVLRRPLGTHVAAERVPAELRAPVDPFAGLFEAPEIVASFSVTDIFRMKRRPGIAANRSASVPFDLMDYPR